MRSLLTIVVLSTALGAANCPKVIIERAIFHVDHHRWDDDGGGVIELIFDRSLRNRNGRLVIPNTASWAEMVNRWAIADRPLEVASDPRIQYDHPTRSLFLNHEGSFSEEETRRETADRRTRLLTGRHLEIQLEAASQEFNFQIERVVRIWPLERERFIIQVEVDQIIPVHISGFARISIPAENDSGDAFYMLTAQRSPEGADKVNVLIGDDSESIEMTNLATIRPNKLVEISYPAFLGGHDIDDFIRELPGRAIRLQDDYGRRPWMSLDSPFPVQE